MICLSPIDAIAIAMTMTATAIAVAIAVAIANAIAIAQNINREPGTVQSTFDLTGPTDR